MCVVFYHPTSLKFDIKGECYEEEVRKCKIDFSEKLSMVWRAAEAFQKGGGENRAGGILFEKGPHDQVILHQSFPVLLGCIFLEILLLWNQDCLNLSFFCTKSPPAIQVPY